jgi:DNA-binding XRE family transcriptional regulator
MTVLRERQVRLSPVLLLMTHIEDASVVRDGCSRGTYDSGVDATAPGAFCDVLGTRRDDMTTMEEAIRPAATASPDQRDFAHELVEVKSRTDPAIRGRVARAREEVSLADQAAWIVKRLRAVRERQGLTQRDVAQRMGTSQSAVAKLEASDHPPMLDSLERYAAAIGARIRFSLELAGSDQ